MRADATRHGATQTCQRQVAKETHGQLRVRKEEACEVASRPTLDRPMVVGESIKLARLGYILDWST